MELVKTKVYIPKYNTKTRIYEDVLQFNDAFIIEPNVIDDFKKYIETKHTDEILPFKKVYFSKNATVSRVKFRDWARHKGIKVVLDPQKADITVIEDFKLDILPLNERLLELKTEVVMDIDSSGKVVSEEIEFYEENKNGKPYYYFKNDYNFNNYIKIIDAIFAINTCSEYIFVNDLLDKMNNLTMDEKSFDNILNMLNSKNEEDIKTALEMMSNFNWKESEHYMQLLSILFKFQNINMNTVSVSQLKKNIDNISYELTHTYDLQSKLEAINKISSLFDNIEFIEEIIKNEIKNSTGMNIEHIFLRKQHNEVKQIVTF